MLLPVSTLVQDDEIVTPDMADKISLRVAMRNCQPGQETDHFIATPIAILIIEGLEIVQICIASDKFNAIGEQAFDMLADRNIAGQESERVGVPSCFDPRFCDGTHQLLSGAQTNVATIFCHDKPVRQVALVVGGKNADQFIHIVAALDDARLKIGVHQA